VQYLSSADGGGVEITVEINATSKGFDDRTQRAVKENSAQLGSKGHEFE
jgi:predicted chitinase